MFFYMYYIFIFSIFWFFINWAKKISTCFTDTSRTISAERLSLHVASNQTRTENPFFFERQLLTNKLGAQNNNACQAIFSDSREKIHIFPDFPDHILFRLFPDFQDRWYTEKGLQHVR